MRGGERTGRVRKGRDGMKRGEKKGRTGEVR